LALPLSSNLVKRGFLSLLGTQFLGAANDNILKGVLTFMVIDGAWAGRLGAGGQGIVGLCFTLPFILLSGYAGQFADHRSKRFVAVLVKVIEIPIAVLALVGFWTGNLWVTLGALVALTCQSAFFGPAKYGMIPELVEPRDLSRANGTINMMTNIAVIVGTLAAGFISDRYNPLPDDSGVRADGVLWLPGVTMVLVAIVGMAAVLFLVKLEPGDRNLKYTWNPFATYVSSIRHMSRTPLLMVALAWGYFYLLAGMALSIVPEYTVVLSIDRGAAGVILGIMAIAIGAGSVVAGLVSGHRIEPRLVPVGAVGLSVFFVLLGVVAPTFSNVAVFIFGAGFFAGFYIIPLQALLQHLSPDNERGRFLGTANGISFAFLSAAFGIFTIIRPAFGTSPQRIFLVSAGLMILGTAFFVLRLRRSVFKPVEPAGPTLEK
jgi:acyl-[acyl-carrier-protein]-phospholipid O-acyltransferase/long-chain-fatty-acid--[acyl-carrier-protein] ligase